MILKKYKHESKNLQFYALSDELAETYVRKNGLNASHFEILGRVDTHYKQGHLCRYGSDMPLKKDQNYEGIYHD